MQKAQIPYIVAIVVLCIISLVLVFQWQSLKSDLATAQKGILSLESTNAILENERINLANQNDVLRKDNDTLTGQNTVLQDDNNKLQVENEGLSGRNNELETILEGALPYSGAVGFPITLHNNYGNVHNPSWQELVSFLRADGTESHAYMDGIYMCGEFARTLHDSAEQGGIRAGVAIVHFGGGLPLHAINVFYTTDRGLVYIDDTGQAGISVTIIDYANGIPVWGRAEGEDKLAYVAIGQEYGLIEVDVAVSTDYGFYKQYKAKWEVYDSDVTAYNVEVDDYTLELRGRIYLNEPEYSYFTNWHNRLEQWRSQLEALSTSLGDYWYEPMGIVSDVEIYWTAERWDGAGY